MNEKYCNEFLTSSIERVETAIKALQSGKGILLVDMMKTEKMRVT